jgi:hypothetical protein
MGAFQAPTDIGNRALQHCGANRMDPVLGFADTSVRGAAEIAFCYDKLREAELKRNSWVFSIKEAVIRAVDGNTMKIQPALWGPGTSYFVGSVVNDQSGNHWISKITNNRANDPLLTTFWEPYFGPLTADLYDPTTAYFAGEVVYTAPGDGTYNVYLSNITGNAVDPSLPNQWNSTATYFQNQVVQAFPAWLIGTTYAAGNTVTYTDGNTYSSLVAGNVGQIPALTAGSKWALVPVLSLVTQTTAGNGPLTPLSSSPVIEWVVGTTYGLGSFVMFDGVEYVSIAAVNTGNLPNAAASAAYWVPLTLGTFYMSLVDLNTGNVPASAPALWNIATTYAAGALVGGSDGNIYSSVGSGNIGNNPVTDGGVHWTNTGVLLPWTTVFTQGGGNDQWTQIGGAAFPGGVALAKLNIRYPLGSGPSTQTWTRNAFKLPAGFLQAGVQNPKGTTVWLGGPSGNDYNDWDFESGYLVSAECDPIRIRFRADMTDVFSMDSMFCEGLAARIGLEICETVTQSGGKLSTIASAYRQFMSEARITNAIETGYEDAPDDDFITVRL